MQADQQRAPLDVPHLQTLGRSSRDALIIVGLCAVIALMVNATVHPQPIPLIAQQPYETLVPCPEPGGKVRTMPATDERVRARDTFAVDARDKAAFSRWHLPRAMNVTYDYLDLTPKPLIRDLARRAAASGAKRVVIYGDGENPDSGEHLGKELSRAGIKNVFFVAGGAPALRKGTGR